MIDQMFSELPDFSFCSKRLFLKDKNIHRHKKLTSGNKSSGFREQPYFKKKEQF